METKVKNREWVKDAAIVFLAVLLVLTFFSNTIMNRTLPEVATAAVHEGAIVAKVRGTGTVTATGKHQVKAKETRTVRAVMVKVGQEVKAGDVLFVLGEGDETELEQAKERLRDLESQKSAADDPMNQRPKPATDGDKPRSKNDLIRPAEKKPKKKGFGQKLKEAFFGESIGDGSITENIFFRIFIPKFKQVLSEMANSAINSALGLDNRTRTYNGNTYNTHQANAANYRDRNYGRYSQAVANRRTAISDEVWDGATANDIYSQMRDVIEQFPDEGLTIADVYSIMGFPEKIRSTDRDWGWTSMRGIDLVCIDQGKDLWIIDMPAPRGL